VADRTLVCGVDPVTTTICTGDGLIMNTHNVTLNLNFCTIRGDSGDAGITFAADNVVVRNGRITGFGSGVEGMTSGSSLITGLNIHENLIGVFIVANGAQVKNNLVRLSDGLGMVVLGPGNTVSGNRFEDNGDVGVFVSGMMNTVTGNFAQRNAGNGFEIQGPATVKQNRANYNGLEGFQIFGIGSAVTLNEALANGTDGFTVSAITSNFDRNRSDYNGRFGIRDVTMGAGNNTYTANRCTGNEDGPSSPSGLCT
jgi:parallel beta-helix repeat protein